MPTREELVVAARQGDEAAFASLVEMDGPGALRLARAILTTRSDAEDAVQEAFFRAWRQLPKLRDAERWSAWFRRIVVRCAIDVVRRRQRIREVAPTRSISSPIVGHDVDAALVRADPSAATADLEAGVADRDLAERALARLVPEDRALLALRFLADLEVPDAAAALGLRLGTAKSRLHRLLARLRDELEAEA
ncbi:MAG: RNA polymerase sigma factor [Candidatus Limnocylindrales bacterium]